MESFESQLIREQAELELAQEKFAEAVVKCKEELKKRKWWHKLLPFKIVIIRRDNV